MPAKPVTRAFFNALAERLVEQGWVRQGQNYLVEKGALTVHLDNRNGPAEIMLTTDHFNGQHYDLPLNTVDDYLLAIALEVEAWEHREL
jgi:hypothetical protein